MQNDVRCHPAGDNKSENRRKTSLYRYRCKIWGIALAFCLSFWAGVIFLILYLSG